MSDFALVFDGFVGEQEGLREALTSTGNGYFCTRGAAEWEDAHDVHYPGTYAHGGYNRETTIMGGRPVLNEDLVNLPNWLVLKLRIEGEEAIGFANVELLAYRHGLDIRRAVIERELRFRDRAGRETALRSRRFVSMAHVHQAGIEWTLTPENWSGRVEVITALDGRVTNRGVARYEELEGRHLDPVSPRTFGAEVIALKVQTRQSNLYIAEAARTRAHRGQDLLEVERSLYQTEDYIQQVLAFDVREGEPVRVEKMVAFYTSHDRGINETLGSAGKSAARYRAFADALERHTQRVGGALGRLRHHLPGNERVQLLLRLHISHILQVCSRHTADLDAGVPARGLNGEAYRGHVFWDELYVCPFLNFRLPEITRQLLMYRYRRLGEARAAAREAGFRGAMYPVAERQRRQGGDPDRSSQPAVGALGAGPQPQPASRQRGDLLQPLALLRGHPGSDFLRDYGAEMMLEIARFWASIAHLQPRARPLRDPRRDGPRRVPREVPGRAGGRPAQQRLYERDGRVDL